MKCNLRRVRTEASMPLALSAAMQASLSTRCLDLRKVSLHAVYTSEKATGRPWDFCKSKYTIIACLSSSISQKCGAVHEEQGGPTCY